MTEIKNSKKYDLEDRTIEFAKRVRQFIKRLTRTISNIEDGKQLTRSSGLIKSLHNYTSCNVDIIIPSW